MRFDAACEPTFARHETFQPRYGWVKKAVDAAANDPGVFNRSDAVVTLGVGKNMVRSIRFWGLAYKVLTRVKVDGQRVPSLTPTVIGNVMFGEDGWDPYSEMDSTQWLLHWWLLAPKSETPVWWLAFNDFPGVEFSEEQLEQFILDRVHDWGPNDSSVRKDVSCLLRMYTSGSSSRAGFDDLLDCPTRELGILGSTGEPGMYRFSVGPKPTLDPAVAAFACLDYIARSDITARTSSIARLATEHGSPGRVFKLTEQVLGSLLQEAAEVYDDIRVTTSAGVQSLAFDLDAAWVGSELLRDHYRALTGRDEIGHQTPYVHQICGPTGSLASDPGALVAVGDS